MCTCHGLEHNVRLAKRHLNEGIQGKGTFKHSLQKLAQPKTVEYIEDILVLLLGMFGHFWSFVQIALTTDDAA